MNDCIFCKIAEGEIPGLRICEDDHALAFMDIAGDVDGHMLVIPKAHCISILDCAPRELSHMMAMVKRVSNHLVDNCGYEGVDLMSACGEAAGQTMPHFHIHIIPRKRGDGLGGSGEWPCFPGAKEDIRITYERLKML